MRLRPNLPIDPLRINTRGPANPDVLTNSGNMAVRADRRRRVRRRKCFDARFQVWLRLHSPITSRHDVRKWPGVLLFPPIGVEPTRCARGELFRVHPRDQSENRKGSRRRYTFDIARQRRRGDRIKAALLQRMSPEVPPSSGCRMSAIAPLSGDQQTSGKRAKSDATGPNGDIAAFCLPRDERSTY